MRKSNGYQVVLTADSTLMANYTLLFDGMLAASQTTTTPSPIMKALLMPRLSGGSVRARVAPMGLRRIEAALVEGGFDPAELAVVDYAHLRDAIGPATRIVGVSSGEPCGLGMNTSTMTAIAGGKIYPLAMFRKLMSEVRRLLSARSPSARVILGGPGAWQVAGSEAARAELGIHHVVTGYAEGNIAAIFRRIISGEAAPAVIAGESVPGARVPRIRGATTMGVIEISRGCGLGCSFCTIAREPMSHLPEGAIIDDATTNVAAGVASIAALSEDFFRYGASGTNVQPQALISLLKQLRKINGLRLIQIDHVNVLSVSRFSDDDLKTVHDLLVGSGRHRYPWVNIGIETASGRLLEASGGAVKMGCEPGDWASFSAQQVRRLCRAGFFPMASLMIGLPGETPDDVRATLAWVEELSKERISVFPMLHAPIDGGAPPDPRNLSPLHWRLIKTCYRLNFKWVPRMYWDNQAGAGVGLLRRCVMQLLGYGQTLQWKALFAWHSFKAGNNTESTEQEIEKRGATTE
ncbi:MAG: B12-binding domain-containing radical SAM protein [Planctomycetes bacterium]|nr:B12-binding domain-containing radical SAM protein [Planctomycetota bacterium]